MEDIQSVPTRDFFLSLDKKRGVLNCYHDHGGNLWVIFVPEDAPTQINVLHFIEAGEDEE